MVTSITCIVARSHMVIYIYHVHTYTHTQTNIFDCIVANVRALIRNQFQQKQFLHFLNVSSFYYCSVCGGITALSGRFTLIRGVLSVFHRGTIIPESKLRRVHGRVDESCSFSSSAVCSLPPDIRPERRWFVHQTQAYTKTLKTRNCERVKEREQQKLVIHDFISSGLE